MRHYHVSSNNGDEVLNNLLSECLNCYASCSSIGKTINPCPKYNGLRRQGIISNNRGMTFLCCDETKTTKLFREKLEAFSYAFHDIRLLKEDYIKEAKITEQIKVNRLVHNLTSINAHNIQEIYDLVPQELLASSYQKQLDYIQSEIKRNIKKTALMFLRIAKHNIHMKSEFSIYRKLDREDAILEFRNHPIQKVIMNILHTFFSDFSDLGIYVEVGDYFDKVYIDYESIQVALYHLIENASKYAMPESRITIEFTNNDKNVDVSFKMRSLYIDDDETQKIFDEGYSGKMAKICALNGDGIGMWRINQMMSLNKGSVKIINGKNKIGINEKVYADNEFILTFLKQKK